MAATWHCGQCRIGFFIEADRAWAQATRCAECGLRFTHGGVKQGTTSPTQPIRMSIAPADLAEMIGTWGKRP